MNKSNWVHAAIAVAIQLVVALLTGNFIYGAVFSAGLFWGREHAQAQKRIAERENRSVKDMSPLEGADMTQWNKDSVLDFVVALVAVVFMYLLSVVATANGLLS